MRTINIFALLLTISCTLIGFSYLPTSTKYSESITNKDINYGVICDAGSSGTRIFVYKFIKKSSSSPSSSSSEEEEELIDIDTLVHDDRPVVKKVAPGLSTFADKPNQVIEYITPLLKFAENHIPEEKVENTELLIFATAGMRLLADEKKEAIVDELRKKLKLVTRLKIVDSNIRVIDGAWEGIYSWISVNYILGKFKPELASQSNSTVGMIDMGGASVQLAFQLPKEDEFTSSDVIEINLGSRDDSDLFKYKLFSTTFLGFGANEGLRRYEQSLLLERMSNESLPLVEDPCDPKGLAELKEDGRVMTQGSGKWDECVQKVENLFENERNDQCDGRKCFLKNKLAPPDIDLSDVPLFGFSEYWYTTKNFGVPGAYDYLKFSREVESFCSRSWSEIQHGFENHAFPNIEAERLTTNCFKAAWISTVLHEGFNVDRSFNNFQSVLEINGEEMQWALGAMIYHTRQYPRSDQSESVVMRTILWIFLIILVFLAVIVFWFRESERLKYYSYQLLLSRSDSKCDIWMV